MRVAENNHPQAGDARVEVKPVKLMKKVDQRTVHGDNLRLRQGKRGAVNVTSHRDGGRKPLKPGQDRTGTDVTGVENEIGIRQLRFHAGPNQAMGIRNDDHCFNVRKGVHGSGYATPFVAWTPFLIRIVNLESRRLGNRCA